MLKLLILSLLSIFLYSLYIRIFKMLSQTEREEGLSSHKKKNGTITMGGIIFGILPLIFINYNKITLFILLPSIMYLILGFLDDFLIIKRKTNDGINPQIKLLFQVLIASFSFFFYLKLNLNPVIDFKFIKINAKWLFGVYMLFMLTMSTNAFNLTDGIDGLCGGLSILIGICYMIICYKLKEIELLYLIIIVNIPLFVFWCLNYPKAYLFMGDTGSLFLGSFYCLIGLYLQNIYTYLLLILIFIIEVISVVLQVAYFKKTKGKRLFKMAPLHHHFEALGYKEIQVDFIFYLFEIIIIVFILFFNIY